MTQETTTTTGTSHRASPPALPRDDLAIEVRGLRKSFGSQAVLDGIDLEVRRGTVFALLGPNGAGKTTTINILSTLLPPDGGTARVGGHDLRTEPALVRSAIGLTGQFAAIDNLLTGEENLVLMGRLHHLDRAEVRARASDLLERFELADVARQRPATYSGGMRRRLDLAMGLMGRPQVVFLDEPTTGLDPRSRRAMWDIVRDLVSHGATILLTTQYLDEADQLADRIALLDGGRIVAEGTPAELKSLVPGGRISLRFADGEALARAEQALTAASVHPDTLSLEVAGRGDAETLRRLLDRLDGEDITLEELAVLTPDLDDVFLTLTGQAPDARTDDRRSQPEESRS